MPKIHLPRRRALALASVAAALVLAGCGGGGGGGGGDDPPDLRISGTAAKGAPIAGGTVAADCVAGTGTATTNAQGSYEMVVSAGEGPCLLMLTPSGGGAPLYSFTTGVGTRAVANVTPLTNLFVNYLRGVPGIAADTPSAWFALPATQSLLSFRGRVDQRAKRDFLPLIEQLLADRGRTFGLTGLDFLTTAFVPNPTLSPLDEALEALADTGLVTPLGVPSSATRQILLDEAADDPTVPPRSTGSGSSGG